MQSTENSTGSPKQHRELSPILDRICHGSSSVVFNLVNLSKVAGNRPLFKCEQLNKTAIFKYPNFESEITLPSSTNEPSKNATVSPSKSERPIETAIYVPYDITDFERGGYAIYLRQVRFEILLKQHLGLDVNGTSSAYESDVQILNAIDTVPSLDPFLLKDALSFCASSVDPVYFAIAPSDERAVREVIAEKMRPLVARAFTHDDKAQGDSRTERFLDALWNPKMKEGEIFLRALGIVRDDCRAIIEGWKGIAYYKFTFTQNRASIAALLQWLESKDCLPSGRSHTKQELKQLDMFRRTVVEKLRIVSGKLGTILKSYDSSYMRFINEGLPEAFRDFLVDVPRHYWMLGYCSTALQHSSNIFERIVGEPPRRLDFDRTQTVFSRLSTTLSSQSSGQI